MVTPPDTIAAPATPPGLSALAVVRVSGPAVPALTQALFGRLAPPRQARRADYRDRKGTLLDAVLYTRFAAPRSATGEDVLELSTHGNPFIVLKVLEDLFARGCRPAEPGEFTRRSFLNGRMDLSQAEAVMDLIHARSERALDAANQQLRGALSRRLEEMVARTVQCLAEVEAYIDFPEEDLPLEDQDRLRGVVQNLERDTARLLATSHFGEMLRSGVKTVILGEPNVGKSSLLNSLLGRDRALVSPEPGTTRDYLAEPLIIGPHALRLIDTAGLNQDPTGLECRGMEKTMEQAREADLYLWVLDSTQPPRPPPSSLRERMTPQNTLALLNKCDLPAGTPAALPIPYPSLRISALYNIGMEEVKQVIVAMLDREAIAQGAEQIAISARHAHALDLARLALGDAEDKLRGGASSELIASDLRQALAAFGALSGRVDNERMLDELFAKFCIGK